MDQINQARSMIFSLYVGGLSIREVARQAKLTVKEASHIVFPMWFGQGNATVNYIREISRELGFKTPGELIGEEIYLMQSKAREMKCLSIRRDPSGQNRRNLLPKRKSKRRYH